MLIDAGVVFLTDQVAEPVARKYDGSALARSSSDYPRMVRRRYKAKPLKKYSALHAKLNRYLFVFNMTF